MLLTATAGAAVKLWRNDTVNQNRWLKLSLNGGQGNHTAVGARVVLKTNIGQHTQELHGSTGRGNQSEPEMHFGLGAATTIQAATIHWPSGQVQTLSNLGINQRYAVFEPGEQPHHYSGAWFGGPGQGGHGFTVEQPDDRRFVIFWYTFDASGAQTWLVTQGEKRGNLLSGTTYTIDNGLFPPNFDESVTERVDWGTLEVEFHSCTSATASWTTDLPNFSDGSMALTRLSGIAGQQCGR